MRGIFGFHRLTNMTVSLPPTLARGPEVSRSARFGASAMAVVFALAVGGATSFAQLLPGTFNWLFNSVAGWTIPMIALVWFARVSVPRSAVTGALVFVAMTVGYSVVSTLRGYPDTPGLWAIIGLVVGPVLGAATALLRHSDKRLVAVAAGVIAGVLLGDGVRGLVSTPDGWGTWLVFLAAGLAFMAWVVVRRLSTVRFTALFVGTIVVVEAAYVLLVDVIINSLFR